MLPRSQNLFHFTKSAAVLASILKDGFWPRYCLEDTGWYGAEGHDYKAFAMVCFCDIPISRISDHISLYGSFGIGLSREWAIKNGLNPVLYLNAETPLYDSIATVTLAATRAKASYPQTNEAIKQLFAYIKPISGHMLVNGTRIARDFYQESEWRFIAKSENINNLMSYDQYSDTTALAASNQQTWEHCRLNFDPSDVRYIFVPDDNDLPGLMDFIAEQKNYSDLERKILMSRLTSLESIGRDI
jgi:hypothetical protein